MKKAILCALIGLASITMVGCGNNSAKALTNLDKQLEKVEQTVSSTSSSEVSEVSPSVYYKSNQSSSSLQYYKSQSFQNMTREEEVRQQVLSLNAYLKSSSKNNIKLTKADSEAIKNLSNDLGKYTTQLSKTKSEIKKNVNSIKNLSKSSKNQTATESSYIMLNNNMNNRYICLCNIYNNLERIYILLGEDNLISDEQNSNSSEVTQKDENNENDKKTFKKNIDSYVNNGYKTKQNSTSETNSQQNNINSYPQYPVYPYGTPYYNGYNMPGGYNMYNGYGYNGFDFNNGIGYNGIFGGNRFNMGRNTDTFYPLNRNIDTYKFAPNMNGNNFYITASTDNENEIDENDDTNQINIEIEETNIDATCEDCE